MGKEFSNFDLLEVYLLIVEKQIGASRETEASFKNVSNKQHGNH